MSDSGQRSAHRLRQLDAIEAMEPPKGDPNVSFESKRDQRSPYLPALKYRWLTPLYDPVVRWLFREDAMKALLVKEVALLPGQRVLDLGCGTGTLAILLKRGTPNADVVGLDADPDVLRIARRKATKADVRVQWDRGMACALPYPEGSFDAVIASLMLHHLVQEDKVRALAQVHRVLRPGGWFYVVDFGSPQNALMRSLARVSELLEETADGVEGRFPGLFRAAGFRGARETSRFMTPLGTIVLFHSRKENGGSDDRS